MLITRLAPSPTGYLHLGNAWSFLLCWLYARKNNGKVWLRFDDIDRQRSRREYIDAALTDLAWLGLDWDSCQGQDAIFQSRRGELYQTALGKFRDRVYPCFCTRRELRALASAPHIGDEGVVYPGRCASLSPEEAGQRIEAGHAYCLRLACPEEDICFNDLIAGAQRFAKAGYGGDFALMRSDGVWSYQLASAVDDIDMGVNFVLRGRDILPSTPRQIILARTLGAEIAQYAHVPLLLDNKGERLAKRHASLSLAALRSAGVAPEAITGWLASKAGFHPSGLPATPCQLLAHFRLDNMPLCDVISDRNEFTLQHSGAIWHDRELSTPGRSGSHFSS